MNAVSTATWHTFRLWLQGSQCCRTALLTSGASPSPPQQANQSLQRLHRAFRLSKSLQFSTQPFIRHKATRSLHTNPTFSKKQSAWPKASKPAPKKNSKVQDARADSLMTSREINAIFDQGVDRPVGNDILLRLQQRRIEGTLDQQTEIPDVLVAKGLRFLRDNYPVDEDAAINARVDREVQAQFRLPQTHPEQSPYAHSALEQIKKINEEKRAQQKANTEAEENADIRSGKLASVDKAVVQRRTESAPWVQRWREKATRKEIPKISTFNRLFPSGIFTLTAIAFSLLFAQNYRPPSRDARLFPDTPPAVAALAAIVGINVLVFILWRLPPMWPIMNRQFLVVPAYPYAFSMLFAEFGHQELGHLVSNMLAVWLVGTRLHDDIGRGPFLALVLSSATIASFASMSTYVWKDILITATTGASGIVCALVAASCILHEGRYVTIPMVPPDWTQGINTGAILALIIGYDLLGFFKNGLAPTKFIGSGRSHIDHIGHLGGYATGIAAACLIRSTDAHWQSLERSSFWTPWRKQNAVGSDFVRVEDSKGRNPEPKP